MNDSFHFFFAPDLSKTAVTASLVAIIVIYIFLLKKNKNKIILMCRTLSSLMLAALLLNPVMEKVSSKINQPDLAVILDDSDSMRNFISKSETRGSGLNKLVEDLKKNYASAPVVYRLSDFKTESLSAAADEIVKKSDPQKTFFAILSDFEGVNSNIPQNIQNYVLFHCSGETNLNFVRIINVSIKKSNEDNKQETLEKNSDANKLDFTIKAMFYMPETYRIELSERGRTLSFKDIQIKQPGEQTLNFTYSGKKKDTISFYDFKIKCSGKNMEYQITDNLYSIAVEPVNKKHSILCVSSSADWDFMFFNRHLKKLMSASIDYYMPKTDRPLNNFNFKNYNLIILFKPDFKSIPKFLADRIFESVNSGKTSLIFFTGISPEKILLTSQQLPDNLE